MHLPRCQLAHNSFRHKHCCFFCLQILVNAYKFFTLLKNFKGGGGQAPQPWCLQILWLLTNFHTVYIVRHGFTHSTFFFFWLLGQVHQGIDPWGPKSETEGLTILPCRLEDDLISCTYIWYFWYQICNRMFGWGGDWSWSTQLGDRGLTH